MGGIPDCFELSKPLYYPGAEEPSIKERLFQRICKQLAIGIDRAGCNLDEYFERKIVVAFTDDCIFDLFLQLFNELFQVLDVLRC